MSEEMHRKIEICYTTNTAAAAFAHLFQRFYYERENVSQVLTVGGTSSGTQRVKNTYQFIITIDTSIFFRIHIRPVRHSIPVDLILSTISHFAIRSLQIDTIFERLPTCQDIKCFFSSGIKINRSNIFHFETNPFALKYIA